MNRHHPSLTPEQKFRALGVLCGGAVGDALGAPFEFGPAGRFSATFPESVHGGTNEMTGGGGFGWAPGEFTDDTQMALCLAESLIDSARKGKNLDEADLWERLRAWSETATDVGVTTRAALGSPVHSGAAVRAHHATGGRSAGNGTIIRVAPVGILGVFLGPKATAEIARAQALITHYDPAAAVAAVITAEVIRRTIIEGFSPGLALDVLEHVLADQSSDDPDVVEAFRPFLVDGFDPSDEGLPGNGTVWTALGQAWWAVRTTTTFEAAMRAAIDLGGDTDSVAAVAGAFAGARYGLQRIPGRWLSTVNGSVGMPDGSTRHYRQQDLIDMARMLTGQGPSVMTHTEPPIGPTLVDASGVHAANLTGAARAPRDAAVVSLCLTGDFFTGHPHHHQLFLRDAESPANDDLFFVVTDAVLAIEAFLAEGRDVVVHCHGGRSRTGLVLKAWYMHRHGVGHDTARKWLRSRWEHLAEWTESFTDFLDGAWTRHVAEVRGR